jgi:hypothetical protein
MRSRASSARRRRGPSSRANSSIFNARFDSCKGKSGCKACDSTRKLNRKRHFSGGRRDPRGCCWRRSQVAHPDASRYLLWNTARPRGHRQGDPGLIDDTPPRRGEVQNPLGGNPPRAGYMAAPDRPQTLATLSTASSRFTRPPPRLPRPPPHPPYPSPGRGPPRGVGTPLRKAWTCPPLATSSIDSPGQKTWRPPNLCRERGANRLSQLGTPGPRCPPSTAPRAPSLIMPLILLRFPTKWCIRLAQCTTWPKMQRLSQKPPVTGLNIIWPDRRA